MSQIITIEKATLIDIGEVKVSSKWKNLYLKFRTPEGQELWMYYSEHINKPRRLQQIMDFFNPKICRLGMTMSVTYKIVQSQNKSTKLQIDHLANYCL